MTTTTSFDGDVLTPGDAGYDETRRVWNAMVDRLPSMIVRCAGERDVVAAVRTARERDLELAVRCGGHSVLGLGVPHGGLMLDLSRLGGVTVDPRRRRARVQGGALLGALDRAAQQYGLGTTAGNVSHTGVGGLTLGGGYGGLARAHGLACDNVESYRVVTATGEVVTASATEHPELFWGLRGGGGNFGVVTGFEFRLHDIGTRTLVVELDFAPDQAAAAMRAWRDLSVRAPREATYTASIGGSGLLTLGYVWVGDPGRGRALLPELRELGRPVGTRITEPSYVELQRRDDVTGRHALRRYSKGHYLRGLPDAAIDAFLGRGVGDPQGATLPTVGLQAYGGAIADVADGDAAFSHRQTTFEYGVSTSWSDPDEDADRMVAARRCASALAPFASGVYVNALSDDGADGVRRAYPAAKLARLIAVKDAYDPDNVFHLNQNIAPSTARCSRGTC